MERGLGGYESKGESASHWGKMMVSGRERWLKEEQKVYRLAVLPQLRKKRRQRGI